MKINKEFAVKVGDKVFTSEEILRICIDGGSFKMTTRCNDGSEFCITSVTKNVEFLENFQAAKCECNVDVKINSKDFARLVNKYNQDQSRRW